MRKYVVSPYMMNARNNVGSEFSILLIGSIANF